MPDWQNALGPHWLLQLPQWLALSRMSTQAPLQSASPLGHAQAPAVHSSPVGQTLPQEPQFWGLDEVSIQACPQGWVGGGQRQAPAAHVCIGPHLLPHDPQLLSSLLGLTHDEPHVSSPVGHPPAMQALLAHLSPVGQVLPQPPQLFGSEVRLAQNSLQSVRPVEQWIGGGGGMQRLAMHTKPAPHSPSVVQ